MILYIDTTFDNTILAVKKNDKIFQNSIDNNLNISQALINETKKLFKKANLEKKDITAIGVNNGPGNFTSLRVALAYIKAISYYLNVPVIPINSFQAAALSQDEAKSDSKIIVAIDARMNEIYWTIYADHSHIYSNNPKCNLNSELEMIENIKNFNLKKFTLIKNSNMLEKSNFNKLFPNVKIIDNYKINLKKIFYFIEKNLNKNLIKNYNSIKLLYVRDNVAKKKYE